MITILIDSNIVDEFLKHPQIKNKTLDCKNRGLLRIIHTSIQRYENEAAPQLLRVALREVRESVSQEVLAYGLVNDKGHSSKVPFRCTSLGVEEPALGIAKKTNIDKIKTSIDDAATFNTAKHENAIFVSEDKNARDRAKLHGVDSWTFKELTSQNESL
ncbi:hypothetical protein NIES4073_18820 [Kalymmatonema gypsitolerans NIES-4073]|nr:hypothetical protein NIES4073_18820 [Scytonema sp. NIES-4073]